jgi:hypothetical protein
VPGNTITPPIERFTPKVKVSESGCWEWQGSLYPAGYGQFYLGNYKAVYSHRWAYEYYIGPIPEGLVIDHLCRNRKCVNPAHLEAVTQKININRGAGNTSKTHCPRGHAYSEENTYLFRGRRRCKACSRERCRMYKQTREATYHSKVKSDGP